MGCPTTERLFWHCAARPAERFLITKICCFYAARGMIAAAAAIEAACARAPTQWAAGRGERRTTRSPRQGTANRWWSRHAPTLAPETTVGSPVDVTRKKRRQKRRSATRLSLLSVSVCLPVCTCLCVCLCACFPSTCVPRIWYAMGSDGVLALRTCRLPTRSSTQ